MIPAYSKHTDEHWHIQFDDNELTAMVRQWIEATYPDVPRNCKMVVESTDMGVSATITRSSYE